MYVLWRDLVFGLRSFGRKPGFTLTAVASLALGIGTLTAIFTLRDAAFRRPLPLEDADRLVAVSQTLKASSGEYTGESPVSYANYLDFAERLRSVEAALYGISRMQMTGGSEPQRVNGMYVSGNYFDVLRLEPAAGRLMRPEDTLETSDPVAVISHGAWVRLFGADPGALGKKLGVNGESFTIVGVAPRGFHGTELQLATDVFLPVTVFQRISPYRQWFDLRQVGLFRVIGRLREGVTIEQASAEAMEVALQLAGEYPDVLGAMGARAHPLVESAIAVRSRAQYESYGENLANVAAILLFIACLSVANLLFVRGAERAREVAVRQAMGAGRGRLVRQLLTENLLLFVIGGLSGLLAAKAFLWLLWKSRPPEVAETALSLDLDARIWGFALGVAILVGLVFGLWPAVRAARTDLVGHLKESEPLSGTRSLPRILKPRSIVVALQVALALVALIGAGLLLASLERTLEMDLGFTTENLALASVAPGEQGYDEARTREIYRRLVEETEALPGVVSAALSQNRLLRGATVRRQVYLGTEDSDDGRPFNRVNIVAPGFFETVGIDLLHGRDFRDREGEDLSVAIVNETMAEAMWPGQDPIGQRFHFDYPTTPPVEIVGVAANARYREIHEEEQFFIYLPSSQVHAPNMTIHVAVEGDPAALLPSLRETVRKIDPNLVVADLFTMEHFVDEALWLQRASTRLLSLFGALALVLALVGVYGLLSYSVNSRRREFAVRTALGARHSHVLTAVLFESFQVVGLGLLVGLAVAALALGEIVGSLLYEVSPVDPWTYAALSLVLLAAALAGSLLPAWRAARTDPNETLRAE